MQQRFIGAVSTQTSRILNHLLPLEAQANLSLAFLERCEENLTLQVDCNWCLEGMEGQCARLVGTIPVSTWKIFISNGRTHPVVMSNVV